MLGIKGKSIPWNINATPQTEIIRDARTPSSLQKSEVADLDDRDVKSKNQVASTKPNNLCSGKSWAIMQSLSEMGSESHLCECLPRASLAAIYKKA